MCSPSASSAACGRPRPSPTPGDQVAQVAIAVLVYTKTGSAFLTALAYALTYMPPIVGGPLLSGLADLFPRRRVMITLDLVRGGLVAVMALPQMPFAGLCALLFGTVHAGRRHSPPPARRCCPTSCRRSKFLTGSAIGNVTFQASQIAGFVPAREPWPRSARTEPRHWMRSRSACRPRSSPAGWNRGPHQTRHRSAAFDAGPHPGRRWPRLQRPALRTLVFFGWLAGFAVVPEGLAAPYARTLAVARSLSGC